MFSNLEIIRMRDKGYPVETIDIKGEFLWHYSLALF
jgi:hypothetical protein